MAKENSVTLTFGYTGTTETRKYKFDEVDDDALGSVKTKVQAINASLAAGTDGGLATFFRSDDYDATDSNNVVGNLNKIVAAQYDEVTTTDIDLD